MATEARPHGARALLNLGAGVRLYLVGLAFLGLQSGMEVAWALGGQDRLDRGAAGSKQEAAVPTVEVRQAIKDLLSNQPARERKGERVLKRIGLQVVPQLRYWLRRTRFGAERVELVVHDILDQELKDPSRPSHAETPADPLLPRDISAADFFHRKLLEAQEKLKDGDYETARRVAEAVLLLDRDSPLAYELRRIVRESRERMVLRELEPRIDVGSLVYEIGENPQVTFRLINRSRRPAFVELERGMLGTMTVAVTRQFLDATHKLDKTRVNLAIPEKLRTIRLQSGEQWVREFPFRLDDRLPLAGVVLRVQFEATFRPRRWELEGEKDSNIPISAAPAEFWVVPPGHKRTREAPSRRLVTALFLGQQELFLVAGWLSVWAGEKDPYVNEELVDTLVNNLDGLDQVRRRLAQKLLVQATGKALTKPEEWKGWWGARGGAKGGAGRFGSEAPPRENDQ